MPKGAKTWGVARKARTRKADSRRRGLSSRATGTQNVGSLVHSYPMQMRLGPHHYANQAKVWADVGGASPACRAHWPSQGRRHEHRARNVGGMAGASSWGGVWRPHRRPAAPVLRAERRRPAATAAAAAASSP